MAPAQGGIVLTPAEEKMFEGQPRGFPFGDFDLADVMLPEEDDMGIPSGSDDEQEEDLQTDSGFGNVLGEERSARMLDGDGRRGRSPRRHPEHCVEHSSVWSGRLQTYWVHTGAVPGTRGTDSGTFKVKLAADRRSPPLAFAALCLFACLPQWWTTCHLWGLRSLTS